MVDVEVSRQLRKLRSSTDMSFGISSCFTVNMGTGGVAILIGGCPFSFTGQRELGTIFFMIDLVIFLINVAGVSSRAIYHTRVFKNSFYDHDDGIYVPCFALAFATLFVCKLSHVS
jgi:tellurite resistance protein TehA-like permease